MSLPAPVSQTFLSQRLRLHYLDWGNEGAPLLILQHGGRDHCRSFDAVAEELRRDWHVIAPDLRGHGDSEWSADGDYSLTAFVYDFAQLIHALGDGPVTLIGHSLGGNVVARYAGIYPARVAKMVNIEGLGFTAKSIAERAEKGYAELMRRWIELRRSISTRPRRTYPDFEAALARMMEANRHLTDAQARHLTLHGTRHNEDGTLSWKYDHYINAWYPVDATYEQIREVWAAIDCPSLLLWGRDSFFSSPDEDGRLACFRNAELKIYDDAGHWLHHDQFDRFMADIKAFLG
ncbi:alpha/beta hydrolase [Novosphingobium flavum]|uniref:Alpha/beta hydrolase n=1 Tax=Novosphingobium flavum TaxID=1778672 RepID=A0A7X1FSV4_9SPHN|nr:alpha/beta hydrolase [Novosphingobium flavum]MBC2666336.1 alpha/beta hydrolase [Novosphingobium flavum]